MIARPRAGVYPHKREWRRDEPGGYAPPGSSTMLRCALSTPPVGPLQPNTDYVVAIDGWEYPGPCRKCYGAMLHFRTR